VAEVPNLFLGANRNTVLIREGRELTSCKSVGCFLNRQFNKEFVEEGAKVFHRENSAKKTEE